MGPNLFVNTNWNKSKTPPAQKQGKGSPGQLQQRASVSRQESLRSGHRQPGASIQKPERHQQRLTEALGQESIASCTLLGSESAPANEPLDTICDTWGQMELSGNRVQFSSVVQSCLTLCNPMDTRLPCPSPTPRAYSNLCPSSQLRKANSVFQCKQEDISSAMEMSRFLEFAR